VIAYRLAREGDPGARGAFRDAREADPLEAGVG
jgi:hypothetical protein